MMSDKAKCVLITGGNGNLGRLGADKLLVRGQRVVKFDVPGTEPASIQANETVVRRSVVVPRLAIAVILSLVVTFSSYAHDSDRIEQLEREVQETKQRLSILESKLRNENDEKELVIEDDGWKSVANWRKLTYGMSTLSVKKILGDPHKIVGAKNAVWYYDNGGVVRMNDGNVDRWLEPE